MNRLVLLPVSLFLACLGVRAADAPVAPPPATAENAAAPVEAPLADGLYAVWETPRGRIVAELFPDDAPLTVANFVGLAEGEIAFVAPGREAKKPFFDGLKFHRVVPGFVIQGGDPLGTGEGGPGYEFADEFSLTRRHHAVGMLSMANGGPATNGSQFFITLGAPDRLNYMHTVFGQVVRGLDVLPKIQVGDVMSRVRIERVGAKAAAYQVTGAAFERQRLAAKPVPPRAPSLPPLFVNDAGLALPDWLPAWQNNKLHHYATFTKRTIYVRLVPKFGALPAGPSGENPLRALYRTLAGDDPKAALLVFLADENKWRVWFGDALVKNLGVDPATAGSEEGRKALHAQKEKVTAPAAAAWDPAKPARTVDTAITGLIELLDGAP